MNKNFNINISELSLSINKYILEDINIEFASGLSYLLVGRNGAGKSSLMNCILGFENRFEGSLKTNADRNLRMTFLPDKVLVPNQVIGKEYLDSFINIFRDKERFLKKEFESLVDEFMIESYWNQPLGTLSKGMKKAIFLCITFMADSDIIILDEPFEGLDPVLKEFISKKLKQRTQNGALVIVSSHEIESFVQKFDVMICIKDGKITDFIKTPKREKYYHYLEQI